MLVEADLPLQWLDNQGWDPRIEIVQVGSLVRSHLIYTQRFTVVYDTLLGPQSGGCLAQRVQQRAPDKPVVVVVSHSDWDHCWGNQCFEGLILGLQLTAERILGEVGAKELETKIQEHPSYARVRRVAPNLCLNGEARLDGGDLTLQLLHTPGHRPDHLALYVPEIHTLLPGDAVETPFALLDEVDPRQDLLAMESSLQRLLDLPVEWLLCNHAPPQAGNQLVRSNLNYYQQLRREAARAESLEQLLQRYPYSGPPEEDFYRKDHERICRAAWEAR